MTEKPWFLYILECAGDRLYTGITIDVDARYTAHANGKGAKFTKGFPPKKILFQAEFADRSTASRAEIDFKRLTAQEKRRFIARHSQAEKA
jgi:putative endonuclease